MTVLERCEIVQPVFTDAEQQKIDMMTVAGITPEEIHQVYDRPASNQAQAIYLEFIKDSMAALVDKAHMGPSEAARNVWMVVCRYAYAKRNGGTEHRLNRWANAMFDAIPFAQELRDNLSPENAHPCACQFCHKE